jgi:hypothetical protein
VAADTRQHPRYAVEAAVQFRTNNGTVDGRARNVSRGGFSAFSPDSMLPGTQCTVRLALVFNTDTVSDPLELPARIVWCTNLGTEQQLGAAFLALTSQQIEFLEKFLRYLEDGQARRRAEEEPDEPEDPFAS